jgi:competence protein ComEC
VLLLVGDIERRVELQLLQARTPLAADILLAPHHGSQTSSSWPFIRQVQAAHVVFSSGYRNRFKHPAARVVSRYRLLGSHIYSTAHDGAVIFTVREGQLQAVQRYRSQLKRYWL